jgi:protein-L-isoaspartate(D-aspartate) O-methyltransferase
MIISQEDARQHMIDGQLKTNSVHDPLVLQAIAAVSREAFVPEASKKNAYIDEEIAIDEGRFILSPLVYARMLQVAKLSKKHSVQDIGFASGYSSAVLSKLVKSVTAVENSTKLVGAARSTIEKLAIDNVVFAKNELTKGHASNKPYDRIFINGQVEFIPQALIDQLKPEGVIVAVMRLAEHGMTPFIVTLRLDKKGVHVFKTHYQASSSKISEFVFEKTFKF